MSRPWKRLYSAWVLVVALAAVTAGSFAGMNAAHAAPVTAVVAWSPQAEADRQGAVVLAFGPDEDAPLVVRWERDSRSFFPSWTVALAGPGSLGVEGRPARPLAEGRSLWTLGTTTVPAVGTEYELTVAYHPEGALAVKIAERAGGRALFSASLSVAKDLGMEAPQAWVVRSGERVSVPVQAADRFTPLDVTWRLRRVGADGSHGDPVRPNLTVLQGDTVWADLRVPAGVSGEWLFSLPGRADEAARAPASPGAQLSLPVFSVGEEDAGAIALRVQFRTAAGELLVDDEVRLRAGRVVVAFGEPVPGAEGVTAQVAVESTYAQRLPVTVTARVDEIAWNAERLRYEERLLYDGVVLLDEVVDLTGKSATLVLRLPVPERSGTYRVTYSVTARPGADVDVIARNTSALFVHDLSALRLSIATYNLWAENDWPRREQALRAVVDMLRPDILAVQELRLSTRNLLDEVLPGHTRVDDRFAGWLFEGNIYWNADRFELVEYGAEDVGIFETWRRLFWVRLRPRGLERTILVATAHFTYEGHPRVQAAKAAGVNPRVEQAERTLAALDRISLPGEVVFFMGDLNESGEAVQVLRKGGFMDTVGSRGEGVRATWPAHPSQGSGSHVFDWQLFRGDAHVIESAVVDFTLNGVAPSDHKPVIVTYGVYGK